MVDLKQARHACRLSGSSRPAEALRHATCLSLHQHGAPPVCAQSGAQVAGCQRLFHFGRSAPVGDDALQDDSSAVSDG
jgi:hypothetical protein